MSIADELEKLNALKEKGAISEEEYLRAKESLLKQTNLAEKRLVRKWVKSLLI